MQSMKENAANVAASAKAGMEKTKAAVGEKVEKMTAHDPLQKQMATQKKEERMADAEWQKQEAREHNAAARQAGGHGGYVTSGTGVLGSGHETAHSHTAHGQPGYPTGTTPMSAMPGQGTGQPYGGVVEEGVVRTRPSGMPGYTTGHTTRDGTGF